MNAQAAINELGADIRDDPFTGCRACDAIILFDTLLRVKPVIGPFRACANHHFSGGYDYACISINVHTFPPAKIPNR